MEQSLIDWVLREYQAKGWSMSELARRGEINQSYVSAVLSGKQKPGAKFYTGISKAFGVPLQKIERLAQKGEIPTFDPVDLITGLVEIAKELPPEELTLVLDYAEHRLSKHKSKTPSE